MATPPVLPPKTRNNSFRVSTSVSRPSSEAIPELNEQSFDSLDQKISRPQKAASFMNPLYYEVQVDQFKQRPISKTTSYVDNDTDSICFLERNNPDLTPVNQYMDAPVRQRLCKPNREVTEHVYEPCDVVADEVPTRRKICDIFDLVSFKSPLYGTVTSTERFEEDELDAHPQLYDVPSYVLPPPYPPPPLPDEIDSEIWLKEATPPPVPKRIFPPQRPSPSIKELEEEKIEGVARSDLNLDSSKSDDKPNKLNFLHKSSSVQMCGYLFKIGQKNQDLCKRWFALEGSVLCCYFDDKSQIPIEAIRIADINGITSTPVSLGVGNNQQRTETGITLWHFTIHMESSKHMRLAARLPSDRSDWVELLTMSIFSPTKLIDSLLSNVLCSGHLHVKDGITAQWHKSFAILYGRHIQLWIEDKFRSFSLQKAASIHKETSRMSSAMARETGPVFYIDLPEQTLYLQADWTECTEAWLACVQHAWLVPPTPSLADEYLTANDVPVIVSKCLKFVSTFGTTSEGIYRLSGSSSKVRELLQAFRKNAWNVHLKEEDYSPHDVASVFKRYLRTLPQCLMTDDLYNMWVAASGIESQEDRLEQIKQLLSRLPRINYQSLKYLIEHLCIIAEHSAQNRMPALNLSPVFGPTLLFKATDLENYSSTTAASDLVADMITYYSRLFQVEAFVLEKERQIQQALQKMKDAKLLQKPAGDILVGIYIYSKDWGRCLNMKLTPATTALEICHHAISLGNVREVVDKLAVYEVICNGDLERPLHYRESVLQVALKWMNWDPPDAKDNYLCIKHNSLFDAILPYTTVGQPLSVFGHLKFADKGSKTFKKVQFQFTAAKLKCFKMLKFFNQESQQEVGEWKVEELTWYTGVDIKRSAPTRWCVTFIDRDAAVKRSKSQPFFGRCLSFNTEEDFHKLIAAMSLAEHPEGLLPERSLPDLLS